MYIYKTTNLINNKIYIGQSVQESSKSKTYLGSGISINASIKKYGRKNFKKEILEEYVYYDQDLLDEREIALIKKFNSKDKTIGYNIDDGGKGHHPYLGKTEEESKEAFLKMSLTSKKAWNKVLNTYSKQELKNLYNIKRQIVLDYWKSLTKEQKQEIYDKISYSLKNQSEKIGQKTKEHWASKTEEQKQEIRDKISIKRKEYWDKLSQNDKDKFSDLKSNQTKEFWQNVSDEFITKFKDTISKSSKKMWEEMSEETYNTAMKKKSTSMSNLYKNDPEFVKLKQKNLVEACGVKIKIIEKYTGVEHIFNSKTECFNFLKITKGTLNKILNNKNNLKTKHNKEIQNKYKIQTI